MIISVSSSESLSDVLTSPSFMRRIASESPVASPRPDLSRMASWKRMFSSVKRFLRRMALTMRSRGARRRSGTR